MVGGASRSYLSRGGGSTRVWLQTKQALFSMLLLPELSHDHAQREQTAMVSPGAVISLCTDDIELVPSRVPRSRLSDDRSMLLTAIFEFERRKKGTHHNHRQSIDWYDGRSTYRVVAWTRRWHGLTIRCWQIRDRMTPFSGTLQRTAASHIGTKTTMATATQSRAIKMYSAKMELRG